MTATKNITNRLRVTGWVAFIVLLAVALVGWVFEFYRGVHKH